jgi:hypothetical protein
MGIAHAAAGWTGSFGAVTDQALQTGGSRRSVSDPTQHVVAAVAAHHSGGPTREERCSARAAVAICENGAKCGDGEPFERGRNRLGQT